MENAVFNNYKDLITKELSVLIWEHDCVILPGFGGFIGNYSPARFQPGTHLVQPPSKQILFNRNLKMDDGLLTSRLSILLACSFSETRVWLNPFCKELQKHLSSGNPISFSGIGLLKMDADQSIRFIADETVNYLPASFGLYILQAEPINRRPIPERRAESVIQTREFKPVIQVKKKYFTKKAARVGTVALIAMLALVNVTLPAGKGVSTADLNLFSQKEPMTIGIAIPARHVSAKGRKALVPVVESMNFNTENARIFIVAGCYSTKENADGIVHYLMDKGFNSSILDRTPAGLYRVVYDSYADLSAASEELSTIHKGLNEEAWLLIR
jgi:hypothetical protein